MSSCKLQRFSVAALTLSLHIAATQTKANETGLPHLRCSMVDCGRDEYHTEVVFLVQQGFYPTALTKTKCDSGKLSKPQFNMVEKATIIF